MPGSSLGKSSTFLMPTSQSLPQISASSRMPLSELSSSIDYEAKRIANWDKTSRVSSAASLPTNLQAPRPEKNASKRKTKKKELIQVESSDEESVLEWKSNSSHSERFLIFSLKSKFSFF